MYIELTRPATELDLPEALRRFLQALPPNLLAEVSARTSSNVDPGYRDWTLRFRLLGEAFEMGYGDRPDLGLWVKAYPCTVQGALVLPAPGATPEAWAEVMQTALRLKLEQDGSRARRKLDRLG